MEAFRHAHRFFESIFAPISAVAKAVSFAKKWIVERHIGISVVSQSLTVILGTAAVIGVYFAYKSLDQQLKQYNEESFSRNQGAISLAWKIIADANMQRTERGQSSAIQYLARFGQVDGRLILNGSSISLLPGQNMNLSISSFCGTELQIENGSGDYLNISNSFLIGAKLIGRLIGTDFVGSDLSGTIFSELRAPRVDFRGANLSGARLIGGSYVYSGFQGADLRNIQTFRGLTGANTDYQNDKTYDLGYYGFADLRRIFPSEDKSFLDIRKMLNELQRSDDWPGATNLVDFRQASFLKTDLRGADLSNSTITQEQVDQACSDSTTKLPTGRTPSNNCSDQDKVAELRKLFQKRTYRNRERVFEECKKAAATAEW